MPAPTTPTNNRLLVTKPGDMDPATDRGFRETERFINTHPGLPIGGTTGEVLTKDSNVNYDASWQAGGGGATAASQLEEAILYGPYVPFDGTVRDITAQGATYASGPNAGLPPSWLATDGGITAAGLYQLMVFLQGQNTPTTRNLLCQVSSQFALDHTFWTGTQMKLNVDQQLFSTVPNMGAGFIISDIGCFSASDASTPSAGNPAIPQRMYPSWEYVLQADAAPAGTMRAVLYINRLTTG